MAKDTPAPKVLNLIEPYIYNGVVYGPGQVSIADPEAADAIEKKHTELVEQRHAEQAAIDAANAELAADQERVRQQNAETENKLAELEAANQSLRDSQKALEDKLAAILAKLPAA